jgi:carbamate kinase
VIREGRAFEGVDAVIDKDLASATLAEEVGVDVFLMASDVQGASIHYGTPEEKPLRRVTTEEALAYLKAGHFPPGSMGPKIEAAVQFMEKGGKRALITAMDKIEEAMAGRAGTEVRRPR